MPFLYLKHLYTFADRMVPVKDVEIFETEIQNVVDLCLFSVLVHPVLFLDSFVIYFSSIFFLSLQNRSLEMKVIDFDSNGWIVPVR